MCFWISGAGLKANASYDDFFAAAVALSGGGAPIYRR